MAVLETDNPFWRFSLQLYAAPGVAAECLALQDKLGLDVNVLLFAVWLGATRGVRLDQSDLHRIDQIVALWSSEVVRPMRAVRQKLKLMPEIADPQVLALRRQIADAELNSEQIEQALLYRLAETFARAPATHGIAAAHANVAAILGARGADAGIFPLPHLFGCLDQIADRE